VASRWRPQRHGGEIEQRNTVRAFASTQAHSIAAVRYWWKPLDRVKTTVEHQQSLAGENLSTSALAVEWQALRHLALEARGSAGAQGRSLRGGATLSLGEKQFYVREEQTTAAGTVRGGTLFGMQAPLRPREPRVLGVPVAARSARRPWRVGLGYRAGVAQRRRRRRGPDR
jgi:hypothetical protein